jgi:hypothetical protein
LLLVLFFHTKNSFSKHRRAFHDKSAPAYFGNRNEAGCGLFVAIPNAVIWFSKRTFYLIAKGTGSTSPQQIKSTLEKKKEFEN